MDIHSCVFGELRDGSWKIAIKRGGGGLSESDEMSGLNVYR